MNLSHDRILCTHVGSLPRNEALSTLLVNREEGIDIDKAQLAAEMDRAVRHVVKEQINAAAAITKNSPNSWKT
jgi:5-methyltetrahydropteroyltriglutamate--homocysteine methyltransferase